MESRLEFPSRNDPGLVLTLSRLQSLPISVKILFLMEFRSILNKKIINPRWNLRVGALSFPVAKMRKIQAGGEKKLGFLGVKRL